METIAESVCQLRTEYFDGQPVTTEEEAKACIHNLRSRGFTYRRIAEAAGCHDVNLTYWLRGAKGKRFWVTDEIMAWLNRQPNPVMPKQWDQVIWVAPRAHLDDIQRVFVHTNMRVRDLSEFLRDQSITWRGQPIYYSGCWYTPRGFFSGRDLDPELTWRQVRDFLGYDHTKDTLVLHLVQWNPPFPDKLKTE